MNNFQKYISYVYRIVVEKTSSEYNSQLIIAIQNGEYVLNAKNANYSFASLHRVFQQALTKIDIQNKAIESILVLGGGAGSIPTIVYKEMGLNPKMDAVEIDEKVVEYGNKYFGLNEFSNLNVIIGDASNFVETSTKKYDLVIVDLFNGINVPKEFLSPYFFDKLRSLLSDKGELLINFVAYNFETKEQVNEIENNLNKSYTNKVKTYRLENINRIFYAQK